jgi:methionyl-tRNA synthetase
MVDIGEFKKISLKIGRVKEAKDHPNADRLYVLTVDIGGEERELVAGIKNVYSREELCGRLVVVVDNLEPANIRGVESKGMVLAAQDGKTLSLLTPDKEISPGAIVK